MLCLEHIFYHFLLKNIHRHSCTRVRAPLSALSALRSYRSRTNIYIRIKCHISGTKHKKLYHYNVNCDSESHRLFYIAIVQGTRKSFISPIFVAGGHFGYWRDVTATFTMFFLLKTISISQNQVAMSLSTCSSYII